MTNATPTRAPAIDILYVGGPTTLISIADITFITDPTFDASGGEYRNGPVVLRKLHGPGVAVDSLGAIDVALLSHDQHADNLDHAGRTLLADVPQVLTTQAGASRLGRGSVGMAPWEVRNVTSSTGKSLRVTATPARHGPVGIEAFAGDVIGFVISDPDSHRDLVYVTGDTVWFEGTHAVSRRFHPAVVLLFAGAATIGGAVHLTMNANDAIEAAASFAESAIVPVHHHGWAHFTQSQEDLRQTFDMLGFGKQLHTVEPGQSLRF